MGHQKQNYTIGIDIGGTKILTALLDPDFRIVTEFKQKTRLEKGEGHFLKNLVDSVSLVLKDGRVDRKEVSGIGIGCPGFVNDVRGIILASPNIPFLKSFALASRVSDQTKLPVVIGNDVQTGLYGEHQFGAAKGYSNVLGIFMGTGVGGALILNNQLYRGATGSAGEIGHVVYDPLGPLCGCGRRGCLEAFTGRLAISAEAAIASARQKAPNLAEKAGTDILQIKSGVIAKSIEAGDRAIEALMRQKAQIVGSMMANVVNLINPDLIVLGGGVVEAMPQLISREAEAVMRDQAIGPSAKHVRVSVAKLGDHSVVMGAAKRAADRLLDQRKGDRRGR